MMQMWLAVLLVPALCFGQSAASPSTAPPLVPAPAEPAPAAAPAQPPIANQPATPPPPGSMPPPPGATPAPGTQGPTGYPYSPYGSPYQFQGEPPKEIGLIASESAFGVLTAGAITLIPYFLLLKPLTASSAGGAGAGIDPTVGTLLTILIFTAVPLGVSPTIVGIANGSRFYFSDSWPASLSGLGAEAAILALFYAIGPSNPAAELLLLIGSIGIVPLVEVAVLNLTKMRRDKMYPGAYGSLLHYRAGQGLSAGLPVPAPLFSREREGLLTGLQLSLFSGRF